MKMKTNEKVAEKVYWSQLTRLGKSEANQEQVVEAKQKLQSLDFVAYLNDLQEHKRELILLSEVKCFLPWRAACNPTSLFQGPAPSMKWWPGEEIV